MSWNDLARASAVYVSLMDVGPGKAPGTEPIEEIWKGGLGLLIDALRPFLGDNVRHFDWDELNEEKTTAAIQFYFDHCVRDVRKVHVPAELIAQDDELPSSYTLFTDHEGYPALCVVEEAGWFLMRGEKK